MPQFKHPLSGDVITVPDALADYQTRLGWERQDTEEPAPEDAPPKGDGFPDGGPTMNWHRGEMLAFAEANHIDLGDADTKAEILAVLRQVGEARALLADQDPGNVPDSPNDLSGDTPENQEN